MTPKGAAAGAVAVALVAGVAWALWDAPAKAPRPSAAPPSQPVQAVREPHAPPPPPALPCAFRVGDGAIYAGHDLVRGVVDLTGLHALMSAGKAPGAGLDSGSAVAQETTWQAHMRVLRVEPAGGALLAWRFASVTGSNQPAGDLLQTLLVRLDGRCHITAFGWRSAADRQVVRALQGVLATLDFQVPAPLVAGRSAGVGSDARGTFRYRMVIGETDAGLQLARRKTGYEAVRNARGTMAMDHSTSGDGLTVELLPGAWYRRAKLSEVATFGHAGVAMSRLQVSAEAELVEGQADAGAVDPDDGSWTFGSLLGDVDPQRPQADPALAALNFAGLEAQLDALIRKGDDGPRSVLLMTAWLTAHPEAVADVERWIRDLGAKDAATKARARQWLAALGQSGLPAARRALRALALDRSLYEPLRGAAAFSLATAEGFDGDDLEALLALSRQREAGAATDPFAHHAAAVGTAMLGAAAHNVGAAQPELAAKATAELAARLAQERDPALLKAAINGAGNSGSVGLLGALQPHLGADDAGVRAEAAAALRLMPLAATAPVFVARMGAETNDRVVEQLVHAVAAQLMLAGGAPPEAIVQTALAHYGGKHNSTVELELTQLLGEASARHAGAKQALQARFAAEMAKGAAGAEGQIIRRIGMFLSAAELKAAVGP